MEQEMQDWRRQSKHGWVTLKNTEKWEEKHLCLIERQMNNIFHMIRVERSLLYLHLWSSSRYSLIKQFIRVTLWSLTAALFLWWFQGFISLSSLVFGPASYLHLHHYPISHFTSVPFYLLSDFYLRSKEGTNTHCDNLK